MPYTQSSLERFNKIFGVRKYSPGEKLRHNLSVFRKDRDDDDDDRKLNVADLSDDQLAELADQLDDGETDIDEGGNRVDRHGRQKHQVEQIADMLITANPKLTKQTAMYHLLHTARGAAIAQRLKKALKRKDEKMTNYKPADIVRMAKRINKIFGVRKYSPGEKLRHNLSVFRKDRDDDDDDRKLNVADLSDDQLAELADQLDDGETDIDEGGNRVDRHGRQKHQVEQIADMLITANPKLTKQTAMYHLLHTARGAAIAQRLKKALKRKDEKMTNYKPADIVRMANRIANDGRTSLSEAQLTTAITAYAKSVYPDMTPDRAFARAYTEQSETGLAFRRAIAITKGMLMPLLGVYVGGDAVDVDDPEDALGQIEALVAQMRAAQPALSKAQAFSKVYCDPANRHLAQAERRQNRPRA